MYIYILYQYLITMTCFHVGYALIRQLHLRPNKFSEARNGTQTINVEVADGV